jgi:hypothetical protein
MALDNNDIKQLIAILQKGLTDENNEEEISVEQPPTKTKHKNNIKTKKSRVSNDNETNKFLSLGFDKLHKDDNAIDKLLKKNPPTARNRSVKILDVKCRVCGKAEKISASLLHESPDRYKCNKCCSSPG